MMVALHNTTQAHCWSLSTVQNDSKLHQVNIHTTATIWTPSEKRNKENLHLKILL